MITLLEEVNQDINLAAEILANEHRLLKEAGLQVRKLEPLLCPKEDETTQQSRVTSSQTQVSQLQKQLEITKQNMKSKEQQLKTAMKNLKSQEEQLQKVTTVNKSLQAALKRGKEAQNISINLNRRLEQENSHLKEQISAYTSGLYEMTSDPRGVAVIINNIRFEDMADREGAEGDTDRLREVFESLGFTALTFTDLDHAKMVAAMKDQGKADHSNHDCFVCCIMSHGTMGKVFSSDDVGLDICELMKPVNAKKCPSLKGKPKLFFIQACQGEKTQGRENFDGDHDAKPVPFICHEADFFLGLATVPGYVALRDPDGAPYVKHLAKMLRDFGPTHDLSAIMAMVCDKMNEVDAEKCGWISSNHSTLRKNLIFKPK
ncbi:caspase-3-like [Branchiostoma floridae x Branchiostoma belcheri]